MGYAIGLYTKVIFHSGHSDILYQSNLVNSIIMPFITFFLGINILLNIMANFPIRKHRHLRW